MVDCIKYTSDPLTVSSKEGSNSPSENLIIDELLNSEPNALAILAARCFVLTPAKNLTGLLIIKHLWKGWQIYTLTNKKTKEFIF